MTFPTLFCLAANKKVLVRDVWDSSGEGVWNPGFTRSFNDWELGEGGELLACYPALENYLQ